MSQSFPTYQSKSNANLSLMEGALGHLLRYALDGCGRSRQHAMRLLDRLADQPGLEGEIRGLCTRMSDALESGRKTWKAPHA